MLQYWFCFMFWFFGREACGILAPRPEIVPAPPALEGKVLTTGRPGKSLHKFFVYLVTLKRISAAAISWLLTRAGLRKRISVTASVGLCAGPRSEWSLIPDQRRVAGGWRHSVPRRVSGRHVGPSIGTPGLCPALPLFPPSSLDCRCRHS